MIDEKSLNRNKLLMESQVDRKCQQVIKGVAYYVDNSYKQEASNNEPQNLWGNKVASKPVYFHSRQVASHKKLRNKFLQKQMRVQEPIEIQTNKGRIMIKIGHKSYETLVDTGASMNVISENCVKSNPYLSKLRKCPTFYDKAETASGENTINFLYLLHTEIKIHGQNFNVAFHVANTLSPEIILGTPFFQKTHAVLEYTNNGLKVAFNNSLYASSEISIPPKTQTLVQCHPLCAKLDAGSFMTTGHFYRNFRSCLVGGRAIQDVKKQTHSLTLKVVILNMTKNLLKYTKM